MQLAMLTWVWRQKVDREGLQAYPYGVGQQGCSEGRILNPHDIYRLQIIREVVSVVTSHLITIKIWNPLIFPASSYLQFDPRQIRPSHEIDRKQLHILEWLNAA